MRAANAGELAKPDRTQHLAKVKQIQIAGHVVIWSTNDRTFTHTHMNEGGKRIANINTTLRLLTYATRNSYGQLPMLKP